MNSSRTQVEELGFVAKGKAKGKGKAAALAAAQAQMVGASAAAKGQPRGGKPIALGAAAAAKGAPRGGKGGASKGKGKAKPTLNCWTCGQPGHPWFRCPWDPAMNLEESDINWVGGWPATSETESEQKDEEEEQPAPVQVRSTTVRE